MIAIHWHVLTQMEGGYMPSENVYCETESEALECAKDTAERYADESEGAEIAKSLDEDGYTWVLELVEPTPHHLRTVVTTEHCAQDCEPDDCD